MHVYFIRDAMKAWTSRNGDVKAQLLTINDHLLHLAGEDVRRAKIPRDSAGPEGRFPAYKKIHERCIVRREEFVLVLLIATQF